MRRTWPTAGRGLLTRLTMTSYQRPPARPASARSQARRFNRSTSRMTTACMRMPPGPPSQVKKGNVRVSGPRFVAWMSRSTVASICKYGFMTTIAVMIPTAAAAAMATNSKGPRLMTPLGHDFVQGVPVNSRRSLRVHGVKPFKGWGRQPALREPEHERRPADAEENASDYVARPMGTGPDPCNTGQHDHDPGQYPQDWTETRSEPRRN